MLDGWFNVPACLLACLLVFKAALAQQDVDVIRMRMEYGVTYEMQVNNTVEFILDFIQGDVSLSAAPARVRLTSEDAQSLHPIMVSARQNNGAVMWQLPEVQRGSGEMALYNNMQRTLCPHNNLYHDNNSTAQCDLELTDRTTLHISTTCSVSVTLSVRVEAVADFYITLENDVTVEVTPASPRYYFYSFEAGALSAQIDMDTLRARWKNGCGYPLNDAESGLLRHYKESEDRIAIPPRVHLIIEAEDDICAIVSIQNYTCPVFDNEREILYEGQFLTMLRSGSILLERSAYPEGFYVVFIARQSDEQCLRSELDPSSLDIFESVLPASVINLLGISKNDADGQDSQERSKELVFRIVPSITYRQYSLATGLAVLFYSLFYVLFITSVLLLRTDFLKRFVPKATRKPLAQTSETVVTSISCIDTEPVERRDETTLFNAAELNTQRSFVRSESGATLDDSDLSDSDEEETCRQVESVQTTNGRQRPFGLPPQLRLAVLARHRSKILRARSNRYLWMVITVAVFYSLPVMQLVATYQRILNQQGDQDLCYYNFLCAHPLGVVSDFNHVISNVGYALLGILFIVQVARRQHRQRRTADDEGYGIPQHYGILYALGVALVVEALLSGSYHICPNQMNFQFDMAFMYVMAVLCMVKIYQSRHPDINARAHATFGVLAVLIALCLWGVLSNSTTFWSVFTVLHLSTFLVLSLQIYYVGRFKIKGETVARAARELAAAPAQAVRPMYTTRLIALVLANMANWFLAGYGLWDASSDFASHLLYVLMGNTLLYTFFYLSMKLLHRERILWHAWFFIIGAMAFWAPAMYYFVNGSTNWATTPALSRHYNKPCYLLNFFDSHDIWHFLSAIAMFMSFNMLLTWDDGLSGTPRQDIDVF